MDIEELQKKVIAFRDVRDWAQIDQKTEGRSRRGQRSEAKALIDPYRQLVHSIILFGSYALGRAERESDLDVLVILENSRKSSQLKRRFFDMGFKLNTRSRETGGSEVQPAVFDGKEIKHLFRTATPHGACHSSRRDHLG